MKTTRFLIASVFLVSLLLSGCNTNARVGELQTVSQTVEIGNARSVRVQINLGAGNLELAGGAQKLLEANFNYNVDKLKPEVKYSDSTLVVRQPELDGLPVLRNIADFRNEWDVRLYDQVPMDLSVKVGGGTSNLQLAGLSLTRLDINLSAGTSTVDLTGDWLRDLDVTIETGATDITVRLPRKVGVRVMVESGPTMVEFSGLSKAEGVYTNAAYRMSDVTLQVNIKPGIGRINLEEEEASAAKD